MNTKIEQSFVRKKNPSQLFHKLFFNNIEYLDRLRSDPLLLTVFVECARRARRLKSKSLDGLEQREFFLSRTEYEKFGLKPSQQGQIERRLHVLVKWNIIKKTDKRIDNQTGKDKSIVWALLPNKIIEPLYEIDNEIGTDLDNEQTLGRHTLGSNEEQRKTEEIRENIPSAGSSGKDDFKGERIYTDDPLVEYCRTQQGLDHRFVNYGKQLNHLKRIREEYPDEEDIKFVIEEMAADDYWKANPFDMSQVANNMHKYLNRVVMFNKPNK